MYISSPRYTYKNNCFVESIRQTRSIVVRVVSVICAYHLAVVARKVGRNVVGGEDERTRNKAAVDVNRRCPCNVFLAPHLTEEQAAFATVMDAIDPNAYTNEMLNSALTNNAEIGDMSVFNDGVLEFLACQTNTINAHAVLTAAVGAAQKLFVFMDPNYFTGRTGSANSIAATVVCGEHYVLIGQESFKLTKDDLADHHYFVRKAATFLATLCAVYTHADTARSVFEVIQFVIECNSSELQGDYMHKHLADQFLVTCRDLQLAPPIPSIHRYYPPSNPIDTTFNSSMSGFTMGWAKNLTFFNVIAMINLRQVRLAHTVIDSYLGEMMLRTSSALRTPLALHTLARVDVEACVERHATIVATLCEEFRNIKAVRTAATNTLVYKRITTALPNDNMLAAILSLDLARERRNTSFACRFGPLQPTIPW